MCITYICISGYMFIMQMHVRLSVCYLICSTFPSPCPPVVPSPQYFDPLELFVLLLSSLLHGVDHVGLPRTTAPGWGEASLTAWTPKLNCPPGGKKCSQPPTDF